MVIQHLARRSAGLWSRVLTRSLAREAKGRLVLGRGALLRSPLGVTLADGGSLVVGAGTTVERHSTLTARRGRITIGAESYVGVRATIGCEEEVTIGDRVAIGPNVVLADANKNFDDLDVPIIGAGHDSAAIRIGDDCWIGAGATILSGVQLGEHTVVAAGAVVTRSFDPAVVVAGVPARVVAHLDDETRRADAGGHART